MGIPKRVIEAAEQSRDEIRNEISNALEKLKAGPPFMDFVGRNTEEQEITEQELLSFIVARCALLATCLDFLQFHKSSPPSIWLGEVAGILLQSEANVIMDEIHRSSMNN